MPVNPGFSYQPRNIKPVLLISAAVGSANPSSYGWDVGAVYPAAHSPPFNSYVMVLVVPSH